MISMRLPRIYVATGLRQVTTRTQCKMKYQMRRLARRCFSSRYWKRRLQPTSTGRSDQRWVFAISLEIFGLDFAFGALPTGKHTGGLLERN